MKAKCTICGKIYNAKQERSLYCSNKCKQTAHRNRITETVTVTKKENEELRNTLSVTENKLTVFEEYHKLVMEIYARNESPSSHHPEIFNLLMKYKYQGIMDSGDWKSDEQKEASKEYKDYFELRNIIYRDCHYND